SAAALDPEVDVREDPVEVLERSEDAGEKSDDERPSEATRRSRLDARHEPPAERRNGGHGEKKHDVFGMPGCVEEVARDEQPHLARTPREREGDERRDGQKGHVEKRVEPHGSSAANTPRSLPARARNSPSALWAGFMKWL